MFIKKGKKALYFLQTVETKVKFIRIYLPFYYPMHHEKENTIQ